MWTLNTKGENMKKMYFVLGLVIIALLVSCGGGSPQSSVQKFFNAVEKNDTKAMSSVATEETVQLITMFGEKAQTSVTQNGKIKSMTQEIDGDKAKVQVTFTNGETSDVDLVKVNGKWLVSLGK